jgi:hypothetical protein
MTTRSLRTLAALLTAALALATHTSAQAGDVVIGKGVRTDVSIPVTGFGYTGPYYNDFGAHGLADVIRAEGDAARSFSEARINNEHARSLFLENSVKVIQARQERKFLFEAKRAEHYARKRAARDVYLAKRRAAALERAASLSPVVLEQGIDGGLPLQPVGDLSLAVGGAN